MTGIDPYDSLVPVFLSTEFPNRMQQFGSAIFVEFNGQSFLLTAAHVIDELQNGELYVPTSNGLQPIEGYLAHIDLPPEKSRARDNIDIAYYRLPEDFAELLSKLFTPLPQNRTELIESALDLGTCSASGYPANKGKRNGAILSSEIFSFRGVTASNETYDKLALSPTTNIIIHFHKKRAIHPETFQRFPTPSLKGISGGGIFAWPHGYEVSNDWSLPKLIGIVHTFKEGEGLIIGTTLLPILAAITLGEMKDFGGVR